MIGDQYCVTDGFLPCPGVRQSNQPPAITHHILFRLHRLFQLIIKYFTNIASMRPRDVGVRIFHTVRLDLSENKEVV